MDIYIYIYIYIYCVCIYMYILWYIILYKHIRLTYFRLTIIICIYKYIYKSVYMWSWTGHHHNGFVATYAFGHMMYMVTTYLFMYSFSQRVFFSQFVDRKVVGLNAYVLPACSNARYTSQVSIFFLRKIKMTK